MTEIRWATPEDIIAFYGRPHECSLQVIAVIEDGVPIGLGGVYYQGHNCVAFSETKKDIPPRLIIKGLRMFRDMLGKKPCRIIATPHPELRTAPGFLKHCGFVPLHDDIYQYQR